MNSWKACEIQHPLSPELALLEVLSGVISFVANNGLHAVAKRRADFFQKVEPQPQSERTGRC